MKSLIHIMITCFMCSYCYSQTPEIETRNITKEESFSFGPYGVNDLIANRLQYAKQKTVVVCGVLHYWGNRFYLMSSVQKRDVIFKKEWIPLDGKSFKNLLLKYPSASEWNLRPIKIKGMISLKMKHMLVHGNHPLYLENVEIKQMPYIPNFEVDPKVRPLGG